MRSLAKVQRRRFALIVFLGPQRPTLSVISGRFSGFQPTAETIIFVRMLRYAPILLLIIIGSCRPAVYMPKPAGYFRLDTPAAHQYRVFDEPGFPYTFEYPVYGVIMKDTSFKEARFDSKYWINIVFPEMNGVINITYKSFSDMVKFDSLVNESFGLSFVHNKITDGMVPYDVHTPYASGLLYVVGGNVASKYQFTLTDSVKHFMRGALYFDVTPNADSLKPATDFLKQDIEHLFWTLRWR